MQYLLTERCKCSDDSKSKEKRNNLNKLQLYACRQWMKGELPKGHHMVSAMALCGIAIIRFRRLNLCQTAEASVLHPPPPPCAFASSSEGQ